MVTKTVVDPETGEEKSVEVPEGGESSQSGSPSSSTGVEDKRVPVENREEEVMRRLEKVRGMESQVETKLQELSQLEQTIREGQKVTLPQRKEIKELMNELKTLTGESGGYFTEGVMDKILELSDSLAEAKIKPLRDFTLETGMQILRNTRDGIFTALKSEDPKIARFEKEINAELDKINPIYWKNKETVHLIARKVLGDNIDILLKEASKGEEKKEIPAVESPQGTSKGKPGITVSEKEAEELAINEDLPIEKAREVIAAKNKKLKELKETGGK